MNPSRKISARKLLILVMSILTLASISQVETHGAMMGTALSQRSRVKRRAATRRVASVRTGMWGGEHIRMSVGANGAKIEYDCAHGTIDQPIRIDRNGRFDVRGTHTREAGGPVRIDNPPRGQAARYVGRISGTRMTLSVSLVGSGQAVGTFSLDFGAEPRIFKCY